MIAAALVVALSVTPLPDCITAEAKLLVTLDSRTTVSGDPFTFKTVGTTIGHGHVPDIPAGTPGWGVVAFAQHARMAGQAGQIVLEPRFLSLHDGRHLPATMDPHLTDEFANGASGNAPDALAFVPVVGWAVGGYNAIHRGKEITVPAGTPLRLVLGDGLAMGRCADPKASQL